MFSVEPEKRISSLLYKFEEGNLIIDYSEGFCTQTSIGKFNVEQGTVVNLIFYPKLQRKLSYYKIDIKGMKKGGDDTDAKIYFDDEKGVAYSIYAGKVDSIEYYPAKKYDFLECQK